MTIEGSSTAMMMKTWMLRVTKAGVLFTGSQLPGCLITTGNKFWTRFLQRSDSAEEAQENYCETCFTLGLALPPQLHADAR